MMILHNLIQRNVVLLILFFLITACTQKTQTPPKVSDVYLVWPPEPAKPRVVFVKAFSRPEDLGITNGFFQRLGELFTGRPDIYMVRPMAIATSPDGVAYVADPGVKGVHRFDPVNGRYDLIRGKGREPLPSPVGLAIGSKGEVYVADSHLEKIFLISPGTKVAVPMPLKTKMEQPTGIAFDQRTDQLYVIETAAHQVKVFGLDGNLRFTFGQRGAGDGEFNYPTLIWLDKDGRLLITDSLNFRIQIFDRNGKFLRKFGILGDATGYHSRPKGVATDQFGHIYVVDSLFHTVQIFNISGGFLLNFGSQGRGLGEFWLPTGIFIGEKETIYVADSHNQRVQVFRYIGGEL